MEFTETQIQGMLNELKDELGPDIPTRELALLELEDMKRKGCVLEFACKFDQCRKCSASANCPVIGWEKRHPEYVDDELAMKITALEAGGEEAYKEKQKKQEKAKKIAEEESKKRAMNIKRAERILIDNGIDFDEASTVLQAIGFALLDKDLYESES